MKMELQVNIKVHWIIVVHVYILSDKVVHEQITRYSQNCAQVC